MDSFTRYRLGHGDLRVPDCLFQPGYPTPERRIPKNQVLVYDAAKGVLQIQKQDPLNGDEGKADVESVVVVSIGGTCRNPCVRGARAAWAVYLGPESPHNASAPLDPSLPQTEGRAELEALRQALDIIKTRIISGDFQPRRCLIKTHSSYIHRVFPSLVRRWAAEGGRNVFGERVVFFELVMDIAERVEEIGNGGGEEGGTKVVFWHCTREENREAEGLAVDALAQV